MLFGGRPLKSSDPKLGVMDMIPAVTLLEYLDGLVGLGASKVAFLCQE